MIATKVNYSCPWLVSEPVPGIFAALILVSEFYNYYKRTGESTGEMLTRQSLSARWGGNGL
jgi:hypothetical protein